MVKSTSQQKDDQASSASAPMQHATSEAAVNKNTTHKTNWKTNYASASWDAQDWEQTEWDANSSYDDSSSWKHAQSEVCQLQNNFPLFAVQDDPTRLAQDARFKCLKCYQPFMKWSQCAHHIRSTCLPRGIDPTIVDDDESIRMICERLCNPFS